MNLTSLTKKRLPARQATAIKLTGKMSPGYPRYPIKNFSIHQLQKLSKTCKEYTGATHCSYFALPT